MKTDYSKEPYRIIPWHQHVLGMDTETSGLDPTRHGIVELGAMAEDYQKNPAGEFHTYVNPGNVEFDPDAMKANKISMDAIKSAPHIKDVLPSFMDFMRQHSHFREGVNDSGNAYRVPNTHTVGHNLYFDLDHLTHAFRQYHPKLAEEFNNLTRHKHDTQQFSPAADKQRTLHGLGKLYGIENANQHSALGDVRQTLDVYHHQRGIQRLSERLYLAELDRQRNRTASVKWMTS